MANTVNYTTTLDRFAEMLAKRKAAKLSQEKPGASEEDISSEASGIANQQQSADRKSISKARDQVSAKILLNISSILMDISEDVSAIAGALPNLGGERKTDTLAEEEKNRETAVSRLKAGTSNMIQNTAEGVFGLFEKIFAILTPFLLGFVMRFVDLTNPIKLLKGALIGLAAFLAGKFIYQIVKGFTLGLIKTGLEKVFGAKPKIINAPNSVINAGAATAPIGGAGNDTIITDTPDGKDKRNKPGSKNKRRKNAIAASGPGIVPTDITPDSTKTTPKSSRMSALRGGLATGARMNAYAMIGYELLNAPFAYQAKIEEGKSEGRAATETATAAGGSIIGGIGAGALAGGALGALGANPITVAAGALIGGTIGAFMGKEFAESITQKAFNFFTGTSTSENNKSVSIFNREEYEKLTTEQKRAQLQFNVRELAANPKELERLKSGGEFIPVSKLTNEELNRAMADIATAKEKNAQYTNATNFNIARGGDMNQQMIVNNAALEAEKAYRSERGKGRSLR